jgi:hypothetical protein
MSWREKCSIPCPDLPILQEVESLLEGNLIVRNMASVCLDTSEHKCLIFGRQEVALFRKWRNKR